MDFSSLPEVCKAIVLRMLYVEEPIPYEQALRWTVKPE
jgi:hypothetical protein